MRHHRKLAQYFRAPESARRLLIAGHDYIITEFFDVVINQDIISGYTKMINHFGLLDPFTDSLDKALTFYHHQGLTGQSLGTIPGRNDGHGTICAHSFRLVVRQKSDFKLNITNLFNM